MKLPNGWKKKDSSASSEEKENGLELNRGEKSKAAIKEGVMAVKTKNTTRNSETTHQSLLSRGKERQSKSGEGRG